MVKKSPGTYKTLIDSQCMYLLYKMSQPTVSTTFNGNRYPLHKPTMLVSLFFIGDKFTVSKCLCIKFTMLKLNEQPQVTKQLNFTASNRAAGWIGVEGSRIYCSTDKFLWPSLFKNNTAVSVTFRQICPADFFESYLLLTITISASAINSTCQGL